MQSFIMTIKLLKGDSLYFEKEKNYAAATKNISILDSLNNTIITGNYGEIFKKKTLQSLLKEPFL